MKNRLTKKETYEEILKILNSNPNPRQVKKAKRLAMSKNIKLGKLKQKFCRECYTFFTPENCEIRIKKPFKIIKCKNCGYISKYSLK